MPEPPVGELITKAIEELNEATPHLVSASELIKDFWERVRSGTASNPSEAAESMVQSVGGLLTWLETVRKGLE